MMPTRQGSVRLFRLFGITVFLHWSWFVYAFIRLQYHNLEYGSYVWYGLEYLTLFLIVLMLTLIQLGLGRKWVHYDTV